MTFGVRILLILVILIIAGCAGFSAHPVKDDAHDANADGIRYYEPAPFLLVYSDGKGNLSSKILIMPDTSKKMVMDLHAVAAKNNSTLTFDNGILTSSKFVLDSTTVPSALIDSIQTLGTAAVSAAFNAPNAGTTREIPAPYLFKIVIDKEGTRLIGGQGTGANGTPLTIHVSVTREAAANAHAGAGDGKEK